MFGMLTGVGVLAHLAILLPIASIVARANAVKPGTHHALAFSLCQHLARQSMPVFMGQQLVGLQQRCIHCYPWVACGTW